MRPAPWCRRTCRRGSRSASCPGARRRAARACTGAGRRSARGRAFPVTSRLPRVRQCGTRIDTVTDRVKTRTAVSPATLGAVLLLCAAGASVTMLLASRPVAVRERPGLVLDPRQVERVAREDVRDGRDAPRDAAARGLDALVHAQNEAETQPLGSPDELRV